MAVHNNLGPIPRPAPPRQPRIPQVEHYATNAQYDLYGAMREARLRMGLWELLCCHRAPADGYGPYPPDVVRLVGDGARPLRALRLEINGVRVRPDPPTRQAAYVAIVAQLPDAMRLDWCWVFVQFPQWGPEEEG